MKNEQLYSEEVTFEPAYIRHEGKRRARMVIRESEYIGWGFGDLRLGGELCEAITEYAAYGDDDPYAA